MATPKGEIRKKRSNVRQMEINQGCYRVVRLSMCIGSDLIGQVSDLGVSLRASDRFDQQATATGWLCWSINLSLAIGRLSRKVCIGVLP